MKTILNIINRKKNNCLVLALLAASLLFASNEIVVVTLESPLYADTVLPVDFNIKLSNNTNTQYAYQIDYGNGVISEWSDFRPFFYAFTKEYQYSSPGTFIARARVKDQNNNISDWSVSNTITVLSNITKWVYPTNSGIYSAPAIGYNKEIYFNTEDGAVFCLNQDGTLQWQTLLNQEIYSSPAIGKNTIYITTITGALHALSLTGVEKWKFETNSSCYTTPALNTKQEIYFGCDNGNIYCISPKGKLNWQYKTGDELSGSPVICNEGTVYVASDAVYALGQNGKLKWSYRPPEEDEVYFFASPIIGNDRTIYIGHTEGSIVALTNKGRIKWIAPTPEEDPIRASAIIDMDGNLIFGDENGIVNIKRPHKDIEQLFETDYYIFSAPAIDELGNIYITSDDGFFYCINRSGKLIYKRQIAKDSKEIMYSSSPIISADGTVYVGSWEGNLYAFTGFAPPMKNTWSLYRNNPQNTGLKLK